ISIIQSLRYSPAQRHLFEGIVNLMANSSNLRSSLVFVKAGKSFSSFLLELLFPSQCRICARLMRDRDGLCAACWRQIHFIERPYCEVLGIPFAMSHGEGTVSALAIS